MPDETTPEDDAVREDTASEDEANEVNGSKQAAPADTTSDDAEQPAGRSPVVIAVIAMLLAIATLGASAYMWRNPLTPIDAPTAQPTEAPEPTFTDAQRDEAKAKVCDAFLVVSTGVANSSGLQAADGDAIGAIAIATNARLALYGGGQYMLNRVDPATEPQLAEAARAFGNALMDVGAAAVANIPSDDPAHQERVKDADDENAKLQGICNPQ
ncbi:hypothetical protein ASE48_04580 [Mycobacterium sp. Root265]|uniref:hypothetical protein n=1 Tax=Mycobacterium sp. Root265 TaxID=1736504 RepID=UPI00070F8252|nr:hypothetical protein [Mycobacterium sp. Root265]KRD14296.1 hypothetical protein ASE48_04580 [Mycobacterium sp. Root265]